MKSLDINDPVIEQCLLCFLMNNETLPVLNGFPLRLIVPGYFATYWVKSLRCIRVLDRKDENFWMKVKYRVPDRPDGSITPEQAGWINTVPVTRMPVRSFLISPEHSARAIKGSPVELRGIAFSGHGGIKRVEVSCDDGAHWIGADLDSDLGPYSFRVWQFRWIPHKTGTYRVAVRATDHRNNVQTDHEIWNPGGYLWNRIERTDVEICVVNEPVHLQGGIPEPEKIYEVRRGRNSSRKIP